MGVPGSPPRSNSADASRRRFLTRGAALGAAFVAGGGRPQSGLAQPAPDDPSKVLGGPIRPIGERSRFEEAVRVKYGGLTDEANVGNWTPLPDLHGIITPSALHYEVHHQGVPDIDPRRHRLLIHGMVEHPVILTMEEIKRLPSVSRIHFLECAGNTQTEWSQPTLKGVQGTHGLTSCSEWTGVLLSVLLREVGVRKGGNWIIAEAADSAGHEHSIPMAKAMQDIIVAYGQNGEALRPENGYPLRLMVPGWEGGINVKWLRRLKVVDQPSMTRMETVEHADLMPDGTARRFTFEGSGLAPLDHTGSRQAPDARVATRRRPSRRSAFPRPARWTGFFEKNGLDWEYVEIDSGKLGAAALLSGNAQFTDFAVDDVAALQKEGKDPVLVYSMVNALTMDMVVRNDVLERLKITPASSATSSRRSRD